MSAPATPQTPPQALPAAARQLPPDARFVLYGMNWHVYETILTALNDRHVFLTYDRGNIEFMAPSSVHEDYADWLGVFLKLLSAEVGIPVRGGGMTTLKRKDVDRGIEADRCFWVQHAAAMFGVKYIDLNRDPPPDLAVEIDITTSWLDRMGTYAALGIPEVWCFNGESLRVYVLLPDGKYEEREKSLAFPFLPLPQLVPMIQRADQMDGGEMVRTCVAWIRGKMADSWKNGGSTP
jgi:Uma2 family endonuclease